MLYVQVRVNGCSVPGVFETFQHKTRDLTRKKSALSLSSVSYGRVNETDSVTPLSTDGLLRHRHILCVSYASSCTRLGWKVEFG